MDSFDVSSFEGATYLHDMNAVLPERFAEQYSVVFDSGSLEHIFNVPVAVRNCMEMVRVGGHYASILPANNFFGHGFYQFSPEFFYSVFSKENGFTIKRVIAFEDEPNWEWQSADPDAPWFDVESPLKLHGRVTLMNSKPLSLIVIANRVARKPIFAITPQQSDYAAIWEARNKSAAQPPPTPEPTSRAFRLAKAVLPAPIRRLLRRLGEPRPRPIGKGYERRFFKPMDPTACLGPR